MKLYTVEETAVILKVAPKTIRKWMSARILGYYRLSPKAVRISDAHIEQFLSQREISGKVPVGRKKKVLEA